MTTTRANPTLSGRAEAYTRDGYVIERNLLARSEAVRTNDAFMSMHASGGVPGRYEPPPPERDYDDGVHYLFEQGDPLARFPRVMTPHLFMPDIREVALDPRLVDLVEEVLGERSLLAFTMFYFKPPGARGQAFHQDNFYLKVKPGTCCAVWIACDAADSENGGLSLVPGTHELEIVCPEESDRSSSFAKELVQPPEGLTAILPELDPGDALLFHGNLIHGSQPNLSRDRFRRSLICHYVPWSTAECHYPADGLFDRSGEGVSRKLAEDGSPCGTPYDFAP
jgi:phytanoyl-CoA hydroxylase